jgi:hypothetical protein
MKNVLAGLLLASMLAAGSSSQANDRDLGLIRLSLMEGDIQVLIQDTTDWTPATINLPLNEQDRLWVPEDGRAELQFQGRVLVRAGDSSGVDILTVSSDSAQLYLDQGHLYLNNRKGGIGTVQVDTPIASVRSYDNSIMMIDVTEEGMNEVSVLKGTVFVESRAGATQVTAGNTLTIRGETDAEISPINAPDEWEQWNVDRDRTVLAWSESSRYLPDELHEYSADFDQNGRWDYVPDYGYAWFPTVVAVDWAPYSYGSWLWIRGNYVWVDYHSWGWAPSHYGRWVFAGLRWCWVPPAVGSVYWGPGYVGWVVTSSYVAWVPLAPGEIYYGYGYYGPGSVNITTVNINTVVVDRHYRNARHRNSIGAVQRDSFGTGRRVPVRVEGNPFEQLGRKRQVAVVPPRTRPDRPVVVAPPPEVRERARRSPERMRPSTPSVRPAVPGGTPSVTGQDRLGRKRTVPQAVAPRASQPRQQQQPPERIRRSRPENLKNERPMVRQRQGSVFRSQPPDNMPVTRSQQPRVIRRNQEGGKRVSPAPAQAPAKAPQQQSERENRGQQRNREDRQRGR